MRAFWIHLYYEDNDIFSEDDIRKVTFNYCPVLVELYVQVSGVQQGGR